MLKLIVSCAKNVNMKRNVCVTHPSDLAETAVHQLKDWSMPKVEGRVRAVASETTCNQSGSACQLGVDTPYRRLSPAPVSWSELMTLYLSSPSSLSTLFPLPFLCSYTVLLDCPL